MTGIGVQHRSESLFTFHRNGCSECVGMRTILPIHLTQVTPTGSVSPTWKITPVLRESSIGRFVTEEACRVYLIRLRWPDGFRCPRCGADKAWAVGALFQCAACNRQTSVTDGTIFQDTRTRLTTWFRAMW